MSESGHVVGTTKNVGTDERAFRWTQAGGMVNLGTVGAFLPQAVYGLGVSPNGTFVVGWGGRWEQAFVWEEGVGATDLGTLAGASCYGCSTAFDANDSGLVVGSSEGPSGGQRAFTWTRAGGLVDLGTLLGATSSEARAVNESGQVAGSMDGSAFVWSAADGLVALPSLLGSSSCQAYAVSDNGLVAGTCQWGGDPRAVLWRVGGTVDVDADGVPDAIDSDGGTGTMLPGFVDDTGDGKVTTGTVLSGSVTVVDLTEPPAKGVGITAVSNAVLSVCGAPAPFTLELAAGMTATVTCGSVVVEDVTGAGAVRVTTPDGAVSAHFEAGESGELSADGTVSVGGGGTVTVTVDGVSTDVPPGGSATFRGWDFTGFRQPVDSSSPPGTIVLDQVKGGQAVPLKWHLANADGSPITSLSSVSIAVQSVPCGEATSTDPVEEVAPGGSGLQNLGGGAVAHDAYFRFK